MSNDKMSRSAIKAIDPSSVHRICSGQVIIDLSTAVKELIENSLDAGATTIDIRLKEYGSELIEVSDDGTGVAKEDRPVLMKKYYTSKLSSFEDLESVSTFGFRGEALSSLCAMSHVLAVTKVQGEECGVTLEFDQHGDLIRETLTARAVGTTISVQDLFHSLPVRHKEFKKNIKRDYSKLVSLLHAYSLVHTNVRFICTNQVGTGTARSMVLSTQHGSRTGSNDDSLDVESTKCSARVLFGKKVADLLIPVMQESKELGVRIEGLVSGTGTGSGSSKGNSKFFYVNKRPIQFPKAGSVLNETYKSFISPAQTQKPICILNFCIETDKYDVNVTPDKRKVFFHHEVEICRFLQECLSSVWDAQRSTYTVQKVVENKGVQYVEQRIDHMFTPKPRADAPIGDAQELPTNDKTTSAATVGDVTAAGPSTSGHQEKKRPKSVFEFAMETPSQRPRILHGEPASAEGDGIQCQTGDEEDDIDTRTPSDEPAKSRQEQNQIVGERTNNDDDQEEEEEGEEEEEDMTGAQCKDKTDELITEPLNQEKHTQEDENRGNESKDMMENFSEESKQNEENHCNIVSQVDVGVDVEDGQRIIIMEESAAKNDLPKDDGIIPCDINKIRSSVIERARALLLQSQEPERQGQKISFNVASMTKQPDTLQGPDSFEVESRATDELRRVFHKENFNNLEIVGQFNLGFIIAKLGEDLFIIDQHASDEKFTFENLQRNTKFKKQRLIKPIELRLSPREEEIVRENMETFSNSGFEFQESIEGGLHVTSVPHCKGMTFGSSDILEMIDMIERGERSLWHLEASSTGITNEQGIHAVYPSRFKSLLASKACRTSIMIGKALTAQKMKEIVCNLSTLVSPWNCPHGRPTMRHLAYVPRRLKKHADTSKY